MKRYFCKSYAELSVAVHCKLRAVCNTRRIDSQYNIGVVGYMESLFRITTFRYTIEPELNAEPRTMV